MTVDGTALTFTGQEENKPGWRYEGNTLMTVITTPRYSVHTRVRIEIHRSAGSLAARSKLDGIPGSIARLHAAYDALNAVWPAAWSPNVLIDAWEMGDRLNYRPLTARQEIARFPQLYEASVAAVQTLTARVNAEPVNETGPRKRDPERDRMLLERAAALLEDGKPQ